MIGEQSEEINILFSYLSYIKYLVEQNYAN